MSETPVVDAVHDAGIVDAESEYQKKHALKRPLGVLHVWGMAVGIVIAGEYFGWNLGLPSGGPVGMLLAATICCLLYLVWVLALSELSVAMPFAGGPLAYGRRAGGPTLGFLMAWSMFLEMLFATITVGLGVGGYASFILNPDAPSPMVATGCAVGVTLVFLVLQLWGVKEQGTVMVWLTNVAIVILVGFFVAVAPAVKMERVLTDTLLPNGWKGVLQAVPYALWLLVCIEMVALAAEEVHEPETSIPRGVVLGQLSLVVLAVLTVFFAVAATSNLEALGKADYPLPLVLKEVWPNNALLIQGFSILALSGLLASFNGMIYSTSRQAFSLARGGYLPGFLGNVHSARRTPTEALVVSSVIIIGFCIWAYFNKQAVNAALLVSTITALIWYLLGIYCLFALRKKEPQLKRPYRVPLFPVLPAVTAALTLFALIMYAVVQVNIIPHTIAAYVIALVYFWLYSSKRLEQAAPEEASARKAKEDGIGEQVEFDAKWTLFDKATAAILVLVAISLVWMSARAMGLPAMASEAVEVSAVAILFTVALGATCWVAWRSTSPQANK